MGGSVCVSYNCVLLVSIQPLYVDNAKVTKTISLILSTLLQYITDCITIQV